VCFEPSCRHLELLTLKTQAKRFFEASRYKGLKTKDHSLEGFNLKKTNLFIHVPLPEYSVRFSAPKVHAANFVYDFYEEYHPFDVSSSLFIFQFYVFKKKTFIAVL